MTLIKPILDLISCRTKGFFRRISEKLNKADYFEKKQNSGKANVYKINCQKAILVRSKI